MKPICVRCQRFYRPKRNGVRFIEGMPIGNDVPSGTAAPDRWKPYKLWVADLWHCLGCGHELIVGAAPVPIAEHFQPHFYEAVAHSLIQVQVNDC